MGEKPESDGRGDEPVARLLEARRGEMDAEAIYVALAERERDPRRADVIRKMAEAEAGHRRRIEGRLKELGVPIPEPASVTLSPWQRLQIRLAPIERVLREREASEDDEVASRYGKPTGDARTDELLREIRKDEEQHSRQIGAMRRDEPVDQGVSPAQERLDRIIGRENWHRSGAGWISGAIYGANDGLAAVFGIVAGVSGATGGSHFVLTAGLAGALASALSMATGAFLAERSEGEVAAANVAREREEIERNPAEEKLELSLYYQLKGLTEEEADALAEALSRHPDAMLRVLATEEFGGAEGGSDPTKSALAAGVSTGVGAVVPVLPFFWLSGTTAIALAAIVSLVAHFLVGAAKALFTLRTWWAAGLEMTVAGIIVGVVTYVVGILLPIG